MVSVLGFGVLLADNVYWLVRNQIRLSCTYKVCVSPRSIETVTRSSTNPQIAAVGNWYFLGQRIANTTLAIPRHMARQRWHVEHLARVRLEVSDKPFIVNPRDVPNLQETSTEHRELRWWRGKSVRSRVYLRFDPRARDYVVAETDKPDGPVFVMPRSEYQAVATR